MQRNQKVVLHVFIPAAIMEVCAMACRQYKNKSFVILSMSTGPCQIKVMAESLEHTKDYESSKIKLRVDIILQMIVFICENHKHVTTEMCQ